MTQNLSRKTAKIFAGNAPSTAVGQFGSALNGTKINTTDIEEIQALTAYTTGWTSAVVTDRNYPTLEETNGVMKVMSYQTAYTLQKGVPEWDSGTTYFSGDMCKAVGSGVLYVSRTDNNLNHPVGDTTYWREYQPSASELPATNYISTMSGSASANSNAITLPAMTLYIPNGRSGDNTLVNLIENVAEKSYTVSASDGEYTLFYNNETQELHLASQYTTRTAEKPTVGNNGDVWYSTDNTMYVVESTDPNYTISDVVIVSSEGVVSNLGTLQLDGITELPASPVVNLKFTTGADVTTLQSLLTAPFVEGSISDNKLNLEIYSNAYGVIYYPNVYSGTYTLNGTETLYSYTFGDDTVYSDVALQLGLVLYSDETLDTPYGTVTALSGQNITVANIATVYDGDFTLVSIGEYYTYLMGTTNYYTSEALANGVTVYSDSTLETEFGVANDVTETTVLIRRTTQVYSGTYTTNAERTVYTYNVGGTTVYSSGVLIPGLIVYTNEALTSIYGVCETVTTSNLVIHSINSSDGYVATSGSSAVAANITIYSDENLQEEVATSTGANATYTGTSIKSQVGALSYDIEAGTEYTGTLSYNGTSYNLILNNISSSLLSSRSPYVDSEPSVVFGGGNAFGGTIDLTGTGIEDIWTWNGFNTVTPDWVATQLCKIGSATIASGAVAVLNIDYPIELVKMTDLDNLNIQATGGGGLEVGDIGIAGLGIDESKGLRRYLNGTMLEVNDNTQAFADKLKSASILYPSLVCTEEEWQEIVSSSAVGQCGKFVINYATEYTAQSGTAWHSSSWTHNGYMNLLYVPAGESLEEGKTYWYTYGGEDNIADGQVTVESYSYDMLSGHRVKFEGDSTTYEFSETGIDTYYIPTTSDTIESIRLPKIIMPIQGLTDLTKLGEIVEAGLPNIEGYVTIRSGGDVYQSGTYLGGAFEYTRLEDDPQTSLTLSSSTSNPVQWSFNASASNSIYGNSDTVQEEACQYPYFIQVATGQETEVNITNEIELNNPFTLFDSRYVEAPLYNVSWLLSNGEFYPRTTYVTAYEALVVENSDMEAGESTTLPSGTTYVKRGLSVKLSTEEYTDYDFVINTTDETFRLPIKTNMAPITGSGDITGSASVTLSGTVPVVGNGKALGLTTGNTNFVFLANTNGGNSNNYLYSVSDFGHSIPYTSGYNTTNITNQAVIGVTTSTTNSGLVANLSSASSSVNISNLSVDLSQLENVYLYFYVGETVQNANLINAGRIAEWMTQNATYPWVSNFILFLSEGVEFAAGEYRSYSLADYLPNDDYNYEVYLSARIDTASWSGNTAYLTVRSDLFDFGIFVCGTQTRTANTMHCAGAAVIPMGSSKDLIVGNSGGSGPLTVQAVYLLAYRRVK